MGTPSGGNWVKISNKKYNLDKIEWVTQQYKSVRVDHLLGYDVVGVYSNILREFVILKISKREA